MMIIIGWFYYSKLYILGSLFVTILLNKKYGKCDTAIFINW